QLHLSASIGISLYPDDGQDDEMLISKADVAMRHAKTLGRNNFQLFSSEMDYFLSQTLHLEQDLRAAI
ncbi:MAG TPA: diguanylate cyclase, partial [Gammaproteobacteria bacterium]|nr:diguanylate cyclase [Gammaproteobacteria bacterium]